MLIEYAMINNSNYGQCSNNTFKSSIWGCCKIRGWACSISKIMKGPLRSLKSSLKFHLQIPSSIILFIYSSRFLWILEGLLDLQVLENWMLIYFVSWLVRNYTCLLPNNICNFDFRNWICSFCFAAPMPKPNIPLVAMWEKNTSVIILLKYFMCFFKKALFRQRHELLGETMHFKQRLKEVCCFSWWTCDACVLYFVAD